MKLDYESKSVASARRRKPLIPPNQSWAGVVALSASVVVAMASILFIWVCLSPHGFAAASAFGVSVVIVVLTTIFALLFALLGCWEHDRDPTLAKWSLWIIAASWLIGSAVPTIFLFLWN